MLQLSSFPSNELQVLLAQAACACKTVEQCFAELSC